MTVRDRPQRILDFIWDYWAENQIGPGYRDIMAGCNVPSTSVVDYHLNRLERLGKIRRGPQSRSIYPIGDHCPVCGSHV